MTYEVDTDADGQTVENIERTHELYVNQLGYDPDDVLVTGTDQKVTVTTSEAIGKMHEKHN